MLFNKPESSVANPQNIAILGTSALSFYLAAELQKIGHRVTVLCRPTEADEFGATDFIIKDTRRLQNRRYTFQCDFEQTTSPQVLLIASEPERLRSDLLLLSPSKLADSLVINFTPTFPSGLVSDILRHPVINAYFGGWLNRDKNHIAVLSRHNQIVFSTDELSATALAAQDIFATGDIETIVRNTDQTNFWTWLAPRLVADLLCLATGKNIADFSKKSADRKVIDSLIAEIISLAAMDNVNLENTAVLTDVYNVPDSYRPTGITQSGDTFVYLERTSRLVFHQVEIDGSRFPVLQDLFRQIRNKL